MPKPSSTVFSIYVIFNKLGVHFIVQSYRSAFWEREREREETMFYSYTPLGTFLNVVMSLGSVFFENTAPSSDENVSPQQQARDPRTDTASQEGE